MFGRSGLGGNCSAGRSHESDSYRRIFGGESGAVGGQGEDFWLANAPLTGASLSVIRMVLRPGPSGGRHRHPNADEVSASSGGRCGYYAGRGDPPAAGRRPDRPRRIAPQIENVGTEDAEMSLVYSSGDRSYSAE